MDFGSDGKTWWANKWLNSILANANEQAILQGLKFAARGQVTSIDIVNHDCSKGKGVLILREALNIKRIAGIGDSMNDLPLIEAADISFTFPHAPERLKEAADHIVGTVGEAISLFS